MARTDARRAAEQFHDRPALMALDFAMGGVDEIGLRSTLTGELIALAQADPLAEIDAAPRRRSELLLAYGFGEDRAPAKPFAFSNGVAVIPIHGMLINRFAYSWGFVTGYNFVQSQVAAATADPDVETIVYDVCSYGGMVAGCEETAQAIFESRSRKKTVAVVDAHAASAAYWLASAADRVVITPSGETGSIGAVATHVSIAGALEQEGIKVSLIYAGARKVDRYPYVDLTAEARAEIQAQVDSAYNSFVTAVSRYRGLSEEKVRATEARMYTAQDARAAGLVDDICPPAQALAYHMASHIDEEINAMTPEELQAALAAARAEGAQAAEAAGLAQVTAERERISAILGCAEAKDRPALASTLATTTAMPLADAQRLLAAAAIEVKPTGSPFAAAMDASGNPTVGAGGGDDTAVGPKAQANQILAAYALATGIDYRKKA